ncbi:MAG TPA: glycosyltransferase family 4 protein [Patescibacteria group bacterium]|nr:glycosyltransferase family 4 protein [Patescibacteria group bacterium]
MKIAMIGQKGIPTRFGGIERHVEALAVRLGRKGHDVLVYTRAWYAAPSRRFSPGVRTIATPTIKTKNLDAIVHTFTSTIHAIRSNVDVIHYHGVGPSLLAWIPRVFAPRIKVVATFHCVDRNHQKWGFVARTMLGLGERAACTFTHETIAVSKTLQSYCMNRFGRDVKYVPNGIEAPGRSGTDVLAKFGLKKDGYIIMVSRLVRHKGAHHLIEAYTRLQKRGLTRGKKLVIVGDSAFTDDYVAELKKMAAGNRDILFTGYLKGKALDQVFAGAYAVVHPSESEGLPIAVLEAMSYGKTVLASDIPENMEVVRDHGMSFRNRSVPDLARKLRVLLDSPALAAEKGAAAKAFVIENYHWDDVAKGVDHVYASLAGPAHRHAALRPRVATARSATRRAHRHSVRQKIAA